MRELVAKVYRPDIKVQSVKNDEDMEVSPPPRILVYEKKYEHRGALYYIEDSKIISFEARRSP
jgi:hypothetical protein